MKWFDPGKGYGFIVPDDPGQTGLKDVLLHVTSLRQSGRESALEGATIVCDVVRRPKGWQVAEIVELDESSAAAAGRAPRAASTTTAASPRRAATATASRPPRLRPRRDGRARARARWRPAARSSGPR